MAKHFTAEQISEMRKKLLVASAELFLTKGYSATTLLQISEKSGIDKGTLIRIFGSKENILAALVKYVLEEQFATTMKLVQNKTTDKILFYASETALQLHIVESSEHLRELYAMAYSLPNTTEIIQETITGKLEHIFKEHLPDLEKKDFYMLEIASGGIMRGFMTVPCNMWFTMNEKIKAFLETTFSLYKVPEEKVKEAIEFVSQFDFKQCAEKLIQDMLDKLEKEA
ncbi:MAG: TetR/AcrR family transcriptional regulator [Clostridia bacterium]|nr:TetR/AcrR family transcriptional regulator [Clostridia bacterium]